MICEKRRCQQLVYPQNTIGAIGRIDSRKILLWHIRCLMKESYQLLNEPSQAAGRKRGNDESTQSTGTVSRRYPVLSVLLLSMVDNSNSSPTRLTALSTLLILASQGAFSSPHFKQRGFVWSCMCSWSCLWSVSSSVWRCFGILTGFLIGLPLHEEEPSAPRSNAS
jgi:hypothetical protein